MTSGHEATDSRIYGKEAQGVQRLGAEVTVVGKLERGRAGPVGCSSYPPRALGSRGFCGSRGGASGGLVTRALTSSTFTTPRCS